MAESNPPRCTYCTKELGSRWVDVRVLRHYRVEHLTSRITESASIYCSEQCALDALAESTGSVVARLAEGVEVRDD